MSHFVIFVTDTDKIPLDTQMAPFDEELPGTPHIDRTKEELIANARMLKRNIQASLEEEAGKILSDWQKALLQADTEDELYKLMCEDYDPTDFDIQGNLLTTYNENSRWDWYMVGGRWSKAYTTKQGQTVSTFRKKDMEFGDANPIPFGVLHHGEWLSDGDVGWWGTASKRRDNWEEAFRAIWDKLPEDTQITVVDCHI